MVVCLFLFNFGIFYMFSHSLQINPLSHVDLVKIFSNSLGCLFTQLIMSFSAQNPFNLM